ncbi:MAG: TetR/AcrR family transcriptional regulator [Eubacteriaceae bacterium]|nr:TetR/AcrR family transcriptional regulator [Eubacteriaceae bacterium]MCR4894377.1 TetR/AcrR family transcriptional regulator [Eubacteriales bacterium]
MDRRQRKTREAIYQAFTALLSTKSFEKITVGDIIAQADIGRTTFYAHFETKDDLLNQMCADIFGHVFHEHLPNESTHDFSSQSDMFSRITHIFYHLRDSGTVIRSLLTGQSGEVFIHYLKKYLREIFEEYSDIKTFGIPKDYILEHMTSDFAETVKWWMKHDEYSPEEIARFYLTTTPFLIPDLK